MTDFSIFRLDIFANIQNNFIFYFTNQSFIIHICYVLAILALNCLIVRFCFCKNYMFLVWPKNGFIKPCGRAYVLAFVAVTLSFLLYAANVLSLNLSIFNNYDQMVANNVWDMTEGTRPVINSMRLNPIAGIDHNIIYGITHNYAVITFWVILKQLLCLLMLYKVFDFISPVKRLYMLAIINFLPTVFWVNSIVYSEQNTLMFILAGFYFLRKWENRHSFWTLLGFLICVNCAIYTKESNILFYFGLFAFSVLYKIFAEEITLKSFLSPVKTVRGMPIEYLLFVSMVIFSVYYFLLRDMLTDGAYVRHHQKDVIYLLKVNALDLLLCFVAVSVFVFKLIKKREVSLLNEGLALGGIIVAVYIVFYLKIACFPDTYKSWYMYLSSVFLTYYLFNNLKSQGLIVFCSILVFFSCLINWDIRNKEEGTQREELAKYMASEAQESIYTNFYFEIENGDELWKAECLNSALKFVYPDKKIRFKTNYERTKSQYGKYYFPFVKEEMAAGDIVIIHRSQDMPTFPNLTEVWNNEKYRAFRVEKGYDGM